MKNENALKNNVQTITVPREGFKSLTVSQDTYQRLAARARPFESPHDVVKRLLRALEENEALLQKFKELG